MTRGISWPALWLGIIGFGILYVPVTVMVIYSFNSSRLVSVWAGFSTKWYGELLENDAVLEALGKSLWVAVNAATLSTVFGVLIAALVFADERLSARKAAGVALGFLGVVVAMGLSNLQELDLRSLAQLACVAAAFCYGSAGSWARARLGHLEPRVAATGMLTASSLMMLPLTLLFEGSISFDLMPQTWAAIAYYSIVATGGAFLLYYSILAKAGAGNLMLVTLLVAPIAIVIGAVVLGEALHPRHYAGFALLALGLAVLDGRVLSLLGSRRRNRI